MASSPPRSAAVRRGFVVLVSAAGVLALAAARPAPVDLRSGEGAVVGVAAWAAWLLTGYLLAGAAATAAAGTRGATGRCGHGLAACFPPLLRRAVQRAVAGGLAVTVAAAPAAASAPHPRPPVSLDWPLLPARAAGSAGTDGPVVVRPGDSLWSIAADALGGDARPARVATAWPRWWAANRDVVGDQPDLIHPGERLRPPPTRRSSR